MQNRADFPRYRAFGLLRFALALVVVMGHAAWVLEGSQLGEFITHYAAGAASVMTFFALSGFILCEAALTFYRGRPMAFLQNRAIKILPTFFGALVLSIAVHLACAMAGLLFEGVRFEGYKGPPEHIFGPGNLAYNFVSFVPVFDLRWLSPDSYVFVRYIWAVKVEIVFYFTLFCIIAFSGMVDDLLRRHSRVLAATFAALVLANEFVWQAFEFRYAGYFALGVAFYLWTQGRAPAWTMGLAAGLAAIHAIHYFSPRLAPLAPLPLFLGIAAYLSQVSVGSELARTDRKLGDLSYSLYLGHYAVLIGYSAFRAWLPSGIAGWLLMLGGAIAVAAMMHVAVEKPLVDLRNRTRGRALTENRLSTSSPHHVVTTLRPSDQAPLPSRG